MSNLDAQDMELKQLVAEIQGARPNQKKLEALLEIYENKFGRKAEQRVREIIAETTEKAWSDIAKRRKNNDIQGILDTLWTSFEKVGGEFTVNRTEDSAQINCAKCPIADTYLRIGKPEYGLIFHCSTDPHIVAGFNSEMKFKITKRIMSGDECCDHYYQLKQHR